MQSMRRYILGICLNILGNGLDEKKMNDMEDALFRYAMAVCRRLGGSVKSQDKGVASINLAQAALKMRLNNMDDALLENPTDLWNLFA